jgi:hypothetical protein
MGRMDTATSVAMPPSPGCIQRNLNLLLGSASSTSMSIWCRRKTSVLRAPGISEPRTSYESHWRIVSGSDHIR